MNYLRTALLLTVLTSILLVIGALFGGRSGVTIMFLISCVMNFSAYWYSDKWILSLYKAEQVDKYNSPKLHGIVIDVARRAGLPEPRVYVIQQSTPNAFATGRDPQHAAVAVTSGLLQLLDKAELTGVIAHELSHIKHRDTLTMTIAATMAGTIGHMCNMLYWFGGNRDRSSRGMSLLAAFVGPMLAAMVQMAISRSREFEADRHAAELLQDPNGLIRALEKLDDYARLRTFDHAEANPSTAHLFIMNPLRSASLSQLFATHPPTEARIQALRDHFA